MRITIIGGREKNEIELSRIAATAGYELEFHHGHAAGRGGDGIRNAVARAALVVIVTGINSHSGVFLAKKEAQQLGKPSLVLEKFSGARLRGLIDALERRRELTWLTRLNAVERETLLRGSEIESHRPLRSPVFSPSGQQRARNASAIHA